MLEFGWSFTFDLTQMAKAMSLLITILFSLGFLNPYYHASCEVTVLAQEDSAIINPSLSELNEVCVLWDSNCTGNRTQALSDFFDPTEMLLEDSKCFETPLPNCGQNARALEFQKLKAWMRSPPCMSSRSEYNSVLRTIPWAGKDFCCDECYLYGDNVDVYYWPDPGADTSCTSLIGSEINPPDIGGTTDDEGVHWDCTRPHSAGDWLDVFPLKTATILSIGSLTFKASLRDPWLPPLSCLGTTSTSKDIDPFDPILARGHSLIIPPSETQENGMRATTVVTQGFTLYVY